MLAKEVLRNSMDLNRRIKEQSVIYQDWKAMAMEIDEDRKSTRLNSSHP